VPDTPSLPGWLRSAAWLSRQVTRASIGLSALGLTVMTLIIGWQVFARYVLNASPSWSEQATLLLMLYIVLLAAAVGVREGFHIRIEAFQEALPPRWKRAVRAICHVLVAGFGVAMAFGGAALVEATLSHVIPTLALSRAWAYLPMSISGVLIALFALEHLLTEAHGAEVAPLWN
jgi:TRAP-type C4-dicarboxylate transport system permease small subunit